MTKRGNRLLKEGLHSFKFREYVSKERMEKIKKHPHAREYFRFRKSGSIGLTFRWFVRINSHNTSYPSKYKKRNVISYNR